MLHIQYEFMLHFQPGALIKHSSTGKGSKGFSREKEVYREPGCQSAAHLLVHVSGMKWYKRWTQSRLVPPKMLPGWLGGSW